MKATPLQQQELLRLQALDTKVLQVAHQTTSLPQHAEVLSLKREADAVRARMTTEGGALGDVRTELGRIESDVGVVEKRIARDTERVQSTSSIKDVQALETELTSLRKRLFDLEEIEIAVMERLEQHEASVAVVVRERDAVAERMIAAETGRDELLADLERQIGELRRDRLTVAGTIDGELVTLYEKRLVTGRGNAAALLRARTCSGCTMTLTGSDLAEVRQAAANEVIFCPDCGAILVRTEESGI
ncbi:C4-type zinc ribbon domain-containing protein [Cryobacterium sp. CG_9.6]|uniref:zinc ribbon domain-containing protein n=1 Tax=Cryobacterium sp. CG_9.6 TaxID=2760710 RepID=UPI0024760129|nr:C4-type zinc ribbon domain-containing protein [Cryobacterium sp. CG_9.6]MDH6237061.1 putative nucleic acid-binding Zn-ribbon protein [Cryobacterium sp. CG_9.6]